MICSVTPWQRENIGWMILPECVSESFLTNVLSNQGIRGVKWKVIIGMAGRWETSQVQVKYEEETWLQGDLSTTSPSYIAVREVGCQTHEFDHGLHTAFARHLENDHPVFGFADQSVHIAKFLLYSFYYLYRKFLLYSFYYVHWSCHIYTVWWKRCK